jgi:hypothetical protein
VQVLRQHKDWIAQFGHPRFQLRTYKEICKNFKRSISRNDPQSTCFYVFNSGKKIGKFFGSFRFLYLDL